MQSNKYQNHIASNLINIQWNYISALKLLVIELMFVGKRKYPMKTSEISWNGRCMKSTQPYGAWHKMLIYCTWYNVDDNTTLSLDELGAITLRCGREFFVVHGRRLYSSYLSSFFNLLLISSQKDENTVITSILIFLFLSFYFILMLR